MWIEKVVNALNKHKVQYAIVGGFAVALHGAVRGTIDLDLIIKLEKSEFEEVQRALQSIGLESRLPLKGAEVFEFREDYIKNRNLIAWSFVNNKNPAEVVDIIITENLNSMKVQKKKIGAFSVNVLSIPDLVRMKLKSGRPQDIEDVKALKEIKP